MDSSGDEGENVSSRDDNNRKRWAEMINHFMKQDTQVKSTSWPPTAESNQMECSKDKITSSSQTESKTDSEKRTHGLTLEEVEKIYFQCKNTPPRQELSAKEFFPIIQLIRSVFTSFDSLANSFPLNIEKYSTEPGVKPIDCKALRRSFFYMLNVKTLSDTSSSLYSIEFSKQQLDIHDILLTSLRRLIMDYLKNSLDSLQNANLNLLNKLKSINEDSLSNDGNSGSSNDPKPYMQKLNMNNRLKKDYEKNLFDNAYSYFYSLPDENRKIVNILQIAFECPLVFDCLNFEMLLPTLCLSVSWLPLKLLIALVRIWSITALTPLEYPDTDKFKTATSPHDFTWTNDSEANKESIPRSANEANLIPDLSTFNSSNQKLDEKTCHLWSLQRILMHHITIRCLSIENGPPNDDKELYEASVLLQLIYYASICAGGIDDEELSYREVTNNTEFITTIKQRYSNYQENDYVTNHQNNTSTDYLSLNYCSCHYDCFNGLNSIANILGVNPINCRNPLIPHENFINEILNDLVKPKEDFIHFQAKLVASRNQVRVSPKSFSFMQFPFLLTPAIKSTHLYYDNRLRMLEEKRNALIGSLISQDTNKMYLKLLVNRQCVVEDALIRLDLICSDDPSDLKKQLFIEFEGEQGVDEGGLSKEFFHLVIAKIFNPDYGMFAYDEKRKFYWFNTQHDLVEELDREYSLIGTILGLAIYNNIILDISFPSVLYRKLMGKLGSFEDLKNFDYHLYNGLNNMLQYVGSQEEFQSIFPNTFEYVTKDPFGDIVTYDLIPNGSQIALTLDNRALYADLIADYLLNRSVKKQFDAFRLGFHLVTNGSPLSYLFRPDEIEVLIRGSDIYDFKELQKVTNYGPDYSEESDVIKFFWNVVLNRMDNDQRKQLLQFATGSDRIPVGGMSKLKFAIVKQGADSNRLPTAHTCFNTLLLPEYSDEEKLYQLLLIAITHSQGFGLF